MPSLPPADVLQVYILLADVMMLLCGIKLVDDEAFLIPCFIQLFWRDPPLLNHGCFMMLAGSAGRAMMQHCLWAVPGLWLCLAEDCGLLLLGWKIAC
ncbi:hypothetical protein Nepgr_002678 [Nepenthes gracilis]|uniref:Uncharacterized protein n=1 Tax=Nepenthes gracilis TaxID=150966 RepID=A0AAD3P6R4_NEPGR|nr:hypothetical protein Nepgr_002678 [Nepenthes gracilis]